jgi:hypothetical protein
MLTPGRGVRGTQEIIKQRNRAYNNIFSAAVSSVRQQE